MEDEVGYLELFIGPMWSGKTSELLRLHKQFKFCEVPMIAINYAGDVRYSQNTISTHDRREIPCTRALTLAEISNLQKGEVTEAFRNASVILVNEAQFFADVVEWVKLAVGTYNKKVYMCGLDGDFTRKPFGTWLNDLIPYCDRVTKLRSYCGDCRKAEAIFSHRLSDETAQQVIGTDNYVPLCRGCYKKRSSP